MPGKIKDCPHVQKAVKYANDVKSGKIKTCELARLSCLRFLKDKKNKKASESEYIPNWERAEKACVFAEKLIHVKGRWAGDPVVLEPWQCFIFTNLFGFEHRKNGTRRFNRAFIFVPRKNGKTFMAAIIGLITLVVDTEPGAEVYCGATTEAQSQEVFRPAKAIVDKTPGLKQHFGLETMKSSIFKNDEMSFFKMLIGKPGEGQSPLTHLCDEYHQHPTSDQLDAMHTGMGARQSPLQLIITTAGVDSSSPCKEFDDYTRQILDGSLQDEQLFALHYTIDKEDSWEDWDSWRKANPNLGVSVSEEYLRAKLQEAKQRVSQQNTVRTKHLNEWMSAGSAWMNMSIWRRCEEPSLRLEDFKGCPCWVGIDLASKIDMTARLLLFPKDGTYYAFGRYYLPHDTIWLPEHQHYQRWVAEGWITETDGARTDFRILEADLKEDFENYPIRELAFDPREASYLVSNIMEWAPFECVEIPQGPAHMSEPMKELEAIVYDGKLKTNGDPVLTWMMSNVVKKQSKGGAVKYYYPSKERDSNKIDGVVALIMALSRAMEYEDQTSVYDTRGVITL